MSDVEAGLVSLRAYNQWMLEEWCGADLNRYIPCQLPWLADAEIAAREIYANAERGFKAAVLSRLKVTRTIFGAKASMSKSSTIRTRTTERDGLVAMAAPSTNLV